MQPEFWHERWRIGQIGFHQAGVDRSLERHWPALGVPPSGSRVFVPLCGKSLDLVWLREQGHVVVGVELSATALESFCLENGIPARRRRLANFDRYEAQNIELYRGDFFALSREHTGTVAAVYDRAALISWAPELRPAYVAHLATLTPPEARMLLLTVEYAQAQMSGPPFAVDRDQVHDLYGANFAVEELSRECILGREERFRARGVTQLEEVCYRLIRRK
jgi:thiopurine S-methyltransferase